MRMEHTHRAIRALLAEMSPNRATAYIQAFGLPPDEETCIILHDIRKKSCIQIADALHISVPTVKRYRQSGYKKIANETEKRRVI